MEKKNTVELNVLAWWFCLKINTIINLFCLVSVLLTYSYFVAYSYMLRELFNPRKKCHVAPLSLSLTMPFSSVPMVTVVVTFGRMYINALWNIQMQTMLSILHNHSLKSRLVGDGFFFCKILPVTFFLPTWRIFADIFFLIRIHPQNSTYCS